MFLLRMRLATATIAFLLTSITQAQTSNKEYFTIPAEYEKQDAVWMGWRTVTSRGIDKSETLFYYSCTGYGIMQITADIM